MATTAPTTTVTVTSLNAVRVAEEVNDLFARGDLTTVNGRTVLAHFNRPPAVAWQNGTVSVTVVGRRHGVVGTVYAKAGQTLELGR